MEYETVIAGLGYFAMLTSAINLITGISTRERNNTDSAGASERENGNDGGRGDDYFSHMD